MKVVSVFAGVLVWLAMSPLSQMARGNTDAPVSESSFDPARGVLFAPERALQLLKQCSRTRFPAVRETWQPTIEQLPALEETVAAILEGRLAKYRWSESYRPHARDYYRQYVGIVLNGRKVIYINGFGTSYSWHVQMWPRPITALELQALPEAFRDPDSWRRVPVVVCDGGPTYFGAIYDPEAGRVDEFSFNGV